MATESAEPGDLVITFNLDARITHMNAAARSAFLEEGDGVGRHFSEFIASEYCRAYLNALCQAADLHGNVGSRISLRPVVVRRPGGRSFTANMRIFECSNAEGQCFIAYVRPA